MEKLDRVKKFTQVSPVSYHDGMRQVTMLFALDATGSMWRCEWHGQNEPVAWQRVEQPPATTRDGLANTTKGVASK